MIKDIDGVIKNINGILPPYQARMLYDYSNKVGGIRLEIGCLAGLSSCCIAMGMKKETDMLISVDTFSIKGLGEQNIANWPYRVICEVLGTSEFESDSFLPAWEKQINSIEHKGSAKAVIGDRIAVIDDVKSILGGEKISLLFIDGIHSYEAVALELDNYLDLVADGGFVLFHDYISDPPHDGIYRAVNEAVVSERLNMIRAEYLCITQKGIKI